MKVKKDIRIKRYLIKSSIKSNDNFRHYREYKYMSIWGTKEFVGYHCFMNLAVQQGTDTQYYSAPRQGSQNIGNGSRYGNNITLWYFWRKYLWKSQKY